MWLAGNLWEIWSKRWWILQLHTSIASSIIHIAHDKHGQCRKNYICSLYLIHYKRWQGAEWALERGRWEMEVRCCVVWGCPSSCDIIHAFTSRHQVRCPLACTLVNHHAKNETTIVRLPLTKHAQFTRRTYLFTWELLSAPLDNRFYVETLIRERAIR